MTYYTIVDEKTERPILPSDRNPDCDDQGMLVYKSREAAQHSAEHLMRQFPGFCTSAVVPVPLHALEERLDAQEPQPEPISVPAAIAILLACLGGIGVLVAVARAVWEV